MNTTNYKFLTNFSRKNFSDEYLSEIVEEAAQSAGVDIVYRDSPATYQEILGKTIFVAS